MINNGYKVDIPEGDVFSFIHSLRTELEALTEELIIAEIAREVELLQDMSFAFCAQYNKSILDTALEFVKGRVTGIKNGTFGDDRYDMRSSINICRREKNGNYEFYCLFNCINPKIKNYFEALTYVTPYKYTPTTNNPANTEAGEFWKDTLERVNWNAALIGCGSQLTFQPDIDRLIEDASFMDNLKNCFREPAERIDEFCKKHIIKDYVSNMVGKADISQISPIILTEFFIKAEEYSKSPEGCIEFSELKEKFKKAFLPISISNITAGKTTC